MITMLIAESEFWGAVLGWIICSGVFVVIVSVLSIIMSDQAKRQEYFRKNVDRHREHAERSEEHMARIEAILERIAVALEKRKRE